MIETQVMIPRSKEKKAMLDKAAKFVYLYGEEPFHMRRKEFWPLPQARKLLEDFIPKLSHEADGLILQARPLPATPLPVRQPRLLRYAATPDM